MPTKIGRYKRWTGSTQIADLNKNIVGLVLEKVLFLSKQSELIRSDFCTWLPLTNTREVSVTIKCIDLVYGWNRKSWPLLKK